MTEIEILRVENEALKEELRHYKAIFREEERSSEYDTLINHMQRKLSGAIQSTKRLNRPGCARILHQLIQRAGRFCSKESLLRIVTNNEDSSVRVVAQYVCWLRRDLKFHGFPNTIQTCVDGGYMLDEIASKRILRFLNLPQTLRLAA